jgi:hypothetical protein
MEIKWKYLEMILRQITPVAVARFLRRMLVCGSTRKNAVSSQMKQQKT